MSEKETELTKMERIYEELSDMTLKRIQREKETKLSKKTLKMISLTQSLHNSIRIF